MSMTYPVAKMRIVRKMREAEHAIDEAMLRNASLFASLITSRRETGSEPFVGHEALLRLAKSQQTLLSAGGDLARVHAGLAEIGKEMGVLDKCPPNEPMGFSEGMDQSDAA